MTDSQIYSEDLGYLNPGTPCFIHTKCITPDRQCTPLDKTEEKIWKRRIKRAKKDEREQVKLDRSRLVPNRVYERKVEKVKSGILLEVTKIDTRLKVESDTINCPICNALGQIALGFEQNEICPQCKQGTISSFI